MCKQRSGGFQYESMKQIEKFWKSGLIDEVNEREFCTKHGQHLNLRGKESMTSRIVHTIRNMIKRKVDPICVK